MKQRKVLKQQFYYKTGDNDKFDEVAFYNEYEETVIIEDEDPPLGPKDPEIIERMRKYP